MAGGVAFLAGGIGNAYTTYASSGGTASNEQMNYAFIVGGAFNLFSLGTSWGAKATSVGGMLALGNSQLKNNFVTGTGIAIGTSVATSLFTANDSATGVNAAPLSTGYTNTTKNRLWLMEKKMGHR